MHQGSLPFNFRADSLLADLWYLGKSPKIASSCRIGTEHEKLGYFKDSKQRLSYRGIEHLLQGLCQKYKWLPIMEGEFIIGAEKDGQSVTIEPGGQFELSGAPVANLHETYDEVRAHLEQVASLFASARSHLLMSRGDRREETCSKTDFFKSKL